MIAVEGRYYMMGPDLQYEAEEEVIYNDDYNIPLGQLLAGGKTLTPIQVQNKLNANGYVGRSFVKRVYQNGCSPLNDIRIRVDLTWSNMTYIWPDQGVFSLDFMRVENRDNAKVLNKGSEQALRHLYSIISGSVNSIKSEYGNKAEPIVKEFVRMGLIKDGRLILTADKELEEVIANLLTD